MPPLPSLLQPEPTVRRALHLVALLLFAGIVIAGSVPGARAEVGHFATGLVLHSMAYGFLALLWFLGADGTPPARALKAIACIALMGAVDEGVQSFLPYRTGDVRDWLVDVAAALVVATVLAVLATRTRAPVPARSR